MPNHSPQIEMVEYRTMQLNRQMLLDELVYVSGWLEHRGLAEAAISFGWDCNIAIDDMWKDESVRVKEIVEYVLQAEQSGIVTVGKGDIFLESPDFSLTLCHDGDADIEGVSDLVPAMLRRWLRLEYEPYGFQKRQQA